MTAAKKTSQAAAEGEPAGREAAELELARQLAERAQAAGLSLTGPGGLLGRLTKVVLEGALEGEMDAHLGYARHDPAGRDGGNSRNGHRAKTVITDVGPVEIGVPRDRDASFAPKIVAKRQRRLGGVDDLVISLVAKGLTTGEVQAHLAEVYGAEVSRDTICAITDRVLEGLAEWQSRPLDAGLRGAVHRRDQRQDPRRPRRQPADLRHPGGHRRRRAGHPGAVGRGARRRRGRQVLAAGADRGQEPRHERRAHGGLRRPERPAGRDRPGLARRPSPRHVSSICCGTASATPAAATGRPSPRRCGRFTPRPPSPLRWTRSPSSAAPGRPATRRSSSCGRTPGPSSCPFLRFDNEIRTLICTTNAIESLNARFRRSVKARGHFPTEQAALKHLYLVIISLDPTGRGTAALDQPLEGRPERLRHHLRRPPQRRQEVTHRKPVTPLS